MSRFVPMDTLAMRESSGIAASVNIRCAHQGGLRSRAIVKRNRCGCSERPFLRKETHSILLSGRRWSIDQSGIPIGADGPFQLVSRFNDVQHDDAFRITNADERGINQPMRSPCFCLWNGKISRTTCLSSRSDGSAAFINPMDF